jgi:hypothetical protein
VLLAGAPIQGHAKERFTRQLHVMQSPLNGGTGVGTSASLRLPSAISAQGSTHPDVAASTSCNVLLDLDLG